MDASLQGRVVLVTGGGAGIGEGIARRFVEAGAQVVIADRGSGEKLAEELDCLHVPTDVTDRAQVEAMVETAATTYGRLDVLVNNAHSGSSFCRVEEKPDERLEHGMAIGYYAPFWAMRSAFGHMKQQRWGRVINMCSLNGVNALMGTLEYNSAKEALRTLTRTAAREWAPFGITVNALCPAAKTPAYRAAMTDSPELESAGDAANPMGRIGEPYADIAPVALFLASEDSRYVTGNTLFADGGAHINGVAWVPELDAAAAD